ncbi:MAG: tetratricopeptide repeat protein [Bacteroidota bacterium]
MKRSLFILILAAMCSSLIAQDSKVTTGVIAYQQNRYEEAIEKLEEALDNKDQIKKIDRNIPKAHIHLAQSYMRVARDTNASKKYDRPLIKAYENLKATKETDTKGRYTDLTANTGKFLWSNLFNVGATLYNNQEYKEAEDYFVAATELDPKDYNSQNLLAFSYWMSNDTASAIKSWETTLDLYKGNPPAEADKNMSSSYLLLATAYQEFENDPKKALTAIGAGREMFPMNQDLQLTELRIYQQNPQFLDEAKAKFEKAIADNPDEKSLKLAYASLLTQNNEEEKGLDMYRSVLENDPNDKQANLNVGAFYVNKAAAQNQKMIDSDKQEDIDKYEQEVLSLLKEAYPYMKKVHEAEPENIEWVNQLVNITTYVEEYAEESMKYIKLQKELRGQ